MPAMQTVFYKSILFIIVLLFSVASFTLWQTKKATLPKAVLQKIATFHFNSFVDCNMAEAWIGDTFRIFPGKYGEDPLWGYSNNLKYASGSNPDEAFSRKAEEFTEPAMPPNVHPKMQGLHGAVWFETVYQDVKDKSGKTLYAVYHNENYPSTLPYDSATGKGYINEKWPQGLTGDTTPAAVCRIGIMKSTDGGHSWSNQGIFIEDNQPRMILKPHNTSVTFAGGNGDPSAVANGDYLYLFYGEYGYAGRYDSATYSAAKEGNGQCISVARIALKDLDHPQGKAKRWSGVAFSEVYDGIGKPVAALQIPFAQGGGPVSSPSSKYYWGPSVSWNTYLHCWVMLMAKSEGASWNGSSIYLSFNTNKSLNGIAAQQWSAPQLLLQKTGHRLWYPSLQPVNTADNISQKNTCLKLGQTARLFYKDGDDYLSEYTVRFER